MAFRRKLGYFRELQSEAWERWNEGARHCFHLPRDRAQAYESDEERTHAGRPYLSYVPRYGHGRVSEKPKSDRGDPQGWASEDGDHMDWGYDREDSGSGGVDSRIDGKEEGWVNGDEGANGPDEEAFWIVVAHRHAHISKRS
ncbi:hypothetical protein EC968_000027 [Mortierella alpina]|nr:hypothetical protein EC968_000027 [Mortierella alpina]